MKIESKKQIVSAPIEKVYNFLSNTENIEKLLPKDEIKDFNGNTEECSFKVQGGITISLKQKELKANEIIKMVSGEKSPFPFKLSIILKPVENKTEGHIDFDGEVNSFLQMMVKRPLTNLFDYMTKKLHEVFEGEK